MTIGQTDLEVDELAIVRSTSLTGALERRIENLIVSGEAAPGSRLNENQLSARFGTSRGPLREALRSLEAKGFVESIRNRGVFVKTMSIREMNDVYDVRAVLFGLAGRLAAERMTVEHLEALQQLMGQMDAVMTLDDVDAYYRLNLDFHRRILMASNNELLMESYERLVARTHLFRVKGLVLGGGLAVSNKEHAEIYAALKAGDPDAAESTHRHHVERGRVRVTAAAGTSPSS